MFTVTDKIAKKLIPSMILMIRKYVNIDNLTLFFELVYMEFVLVIQTFTKK